MSGQPLHHAIVWQDRRTASLCEQLRSAGHEEAFIEKTGLRLDPYFSGTKLKWLLDHISVSDDAAFGTVDSWLLYKLTNGQSHATDDTNASRTLLYNIHESCWDETLLKVLNIPEHLLPEVKTSSGLFGECSVEGLEGIPICGIAGDQQSALFGQACFDASRAKNTYGTGCFLLRPSEEAITSKHNLLTTRACSADAGPRFALEGSVFVGGAVIQWLRDELGIIKTAPESERLAASVPDNGGVYLVPAFAGLGAPHWDPHARGTLCGLTRASNAAHIARAALESIAYQSADLIEGMAADLGEPLTELRVDGGASNNDFLMQFQADIMGISVVRPKVTETTALGAAYLAGLSSRLWKTKEELESHWQIDRVFEPTLSEDEASSLKSRWNAALERSKNWAG